MAQITVQIADEHLPLIEEAITTVYGYEPRLQVVDSDTGEMKEVDNPETRAAFTTRQVLKLIEHITNNYLQSKAAKVAVADTVTITL